MTKARVLLRVLPWLALALVAVVTVVALNREAIGWAIAVAMAERRPAVLREAEWNEPNTAHAFMSRFAPGTQESALVAWLNSNKFTVDRDVGEAHRLVRGLPCNESIRVSWTRSADGELVSAEAHVSEAGCL